MINGCKLRDWRQGDNIMRVLVEGNGIPMIYMALGMLVIVRRFMLDKAPRYIDAYIGSQFEPEFSNSGWT